GYQGVRTVARPILERHRIPAAVFACSGPIASRHALWYDALAIAEGEAAVERVKDGPRQLWDDARHRAVRELEPAHPLTPMTCDELRALAGHDLFEVGGHTVNHPILARLTSADQRREIGENQSALAAWTGRPVRAFAYPNGRQSDYSADTVSLLAGLGFDSSFTTEPGFSTAAQDAFERSRFLMLAGVSAAELAHRLAHSWR